jgi:NADH-quinone oxidoreductase subunit A
MFAFFQISLISLIILSALYLVSFYLVAKKDDLEKLSTYECGFEPLGDARMKISILYWIIGILYLIFDLEIIFIFPYAAISSSTNSFLSLFSIMLFLIILTLGFIYEYIKGALELVPTTT